VLDTFLNSLPKLLFCWLIPSVMWVIQLFNNNVGQSKSKYFRRRAFAISVLCLMLFDFIPNLFWAFTRPADARMYGFLAAPWLIFLWQGCKNKGKKNRGFFFSIWEPYRQKYTKGQTELKELKENSRHKGLFTFPKKNNSIQTPETNSINSYQENLSQDGDFRNHRFSEIGSAEIEDTAIATFTQEAVLTALEEFSLASHQDEFGYEVEEEPEDLQNEADPLDISAEIVGSKTQNAAGLILVNAFNEDFSDIHIEPKENSYKIRVRKDGVIQTFLTLPSNQGKQLIACLKYMAEMDVAERRASQDGKILRIFEGNRLEFRCSTVPGRNGESMVLRLLKSQSSLLNLDALIHVKEVRDSFRKIIRFLNGIIIVSGPTGSGKSTTLAAALKEIDDGDLKIVTIEDPIEYDLGGDIVQAQVSRAKGQTFPNLLRTFMRHDPDVILIGETRDPETAIASMDASETGHLVFTTLHANTATSSLTRLLDMEVPKYKLNVSVRAVLAQRLMRRVCKCGINRVITKKDALITAIPLNTVIKYPKFSSTNQAQTKHEREASCPLCNGTGYKGRIGVYELLIINRKIQDAISSGKTDSEIQEIAENEEGMLTLRQYAIQLVKAHLTTVHELERVCKVQEVVKS